MRLPRPILPLSLLILLSACSSFQRADDAAAAKAQMIGLSREDVLACMGPPHKKAQEGQTEVWLYPSSNGHLDTTTQTLKPTGYSVGTGSKEKSSCTVNVVMKGGIVTAIHYNGETSTYWFVKNDQCGFAVANCVK